MIRLRELRELRGYTVKDMCRILNVSDSRYRKWESGTNEIPLDFSLACCDALRCSLDDLAGRSSVVEYNASKLSDDEQRLVDLYRRCPQKGRELLIKVATATYGVFGRE